MIARDVIDALLANARPLAAAEVARAVISSGAVPSAWDRALARDRAELLAAAKAETDEAAPARRTSPVAVWDDEDVAARTLAATERHLRWLARHGLARETAGRWETIPEACVRRRGEVVLPTPERKPRPVAPVAIPAPPPTARIPRVFRWCWRHGDRPADEVHTRRGCLEWCGQYQPAAVPGTKRRRKAA